MRLAVPYRFALFVGRQYVRKGSVRHGTIKWRAPCRTVRPHHFQGWSICSSFPFGFRTASGTFSVEYGVQYGTPFVSQVTLQYSFSILRPPSFCLAAECFRHRRPTCV